MIISRAILHNSSLQLLPSCSIFSPLSRCLHLLLLFKNKCGKCIVPLSVSSLQERSETPSVAKNEHCQRSHRAQNDGHELHLSHLLDWRAHLKIPRVVLLHNQNKSSLTYFAAASSFTGAFSFLKCSSKRGW
jgi:hypothetical protein